MRKVVIMRNSYTERLKVTFWDIKSELGFTNTIMIKSRNYEKSCNYEKSNIARFKVTFWNIKLQKWDIYIHNY